MVFARALQFIASGILERPFPDLTRPYSGLGLPDILVWCDNSTTDCCCQSVSRLILANQKKKKVLSEVYHQRRRSQGTPSRRVRVEFMWFHIVKWNSNLTILQVKIRAVLIKAPRPGEGVCIEDIEIHRKFLSWKTKQSPFANAARDDLLSLQLQVENLETYQDYKRDFNPTLLRHDNFSAICPELARNTQENKATHRYSWSFIHNPVNLQVIFRSSAVIGIDEELEALKLPKLPQTRFHNVTRLFIFLVFHKLEAASMLWLSNSSATSYRYSSSQWMLSLVPGRALTWTSLSPILNICLPTLSTRQRNGRKFWYSRFYNTLIATTRGLKSKKNHLKHRLGINNKK